MGVRRAGSVAPRLLLALVFGGLSLRLFQLTGRYAVNIFFSDEWDFNDATLFRRHGWWEIFRWQHGPHRQGLGGLLAAQVEPWFRWNSRSEAWMAAALVVAAALLALLLKQRLFGPLAWTDVLIPMAMLSPARWESVWIAANLSLVLFPVLMMLYCLLWVWNNERLKYGLIVLLNLGCIYTGFAFFLGLLTPVLLLASWRRRSRGGRIYLGVCLAFSILSLASFFAGWRAQSASGCPSTFSPQFSEYFWCADLMYASVFGLMETGFFARMAGAAVLALVLAAAALYWRKILRETGTTAPRHVVLAALSTHVILFTIATALARTCLGLEVALSSRYIIYMQMSVLLLYFGALSLPRPRLASPACGLLMLLLLPALVLPQSDDAMISLSERKAAWRACYLSGRRIADCDEECGAVYPAPAFTHLQDKLEYLRRTRQNLFADTPEAR